MTESLRPVPANETSELAQLLHKTERRLHTNAVAWHRRMHKGGVPFESCWENSCATDRDLSIRVRTALHALEGGNGCT